jgi:phage FluMu gp28-like protein
LIRGGSLLAETTPWLEGGYWQRLYTSNFGAPSTALVVRAPTLVFFPTDETRALVQAEKARDPVNAAREYECTWVTAGAAYFDGGAIDDACDLSRPLDLPPDPRARVGVGVDLAFRGDASACVVVMDRGDGVAHVARVELAKPQRGRALVPSEVLSHFAEIATGYGASVACADGHYFQAAQEVLGAKGITLVATGTSAESKTRAFAHAKELLHGGRVRLPPSGPLRDELRAVTVRNIAGGGVKIESPRTRGSHGDAASAWCAALWSLRIGGAIDAPQFIRVAPVPMWHFGQGRERRGY